MPSAARPNLLSAGLRSARIDLDEIVLQTAHDHRVPRRSVERQFGKVCQGFGMEAGGQPLEPHRGHLPVAIATRAAQQIDLARETVDECTAQFRQQLRIIPGGSRQSRVQSTRFISHSGGLTEEG